MKLRMIAGVFGAALVCAGVTAGAQEKGESGYNLPPENILKVMKAQVAPQPSVNPTQEAALLTYWNRYPSIARVSEPYLKLAGVRIETHNHSRHDTPGGYGITPCVQAFDLVDLKTSALKHVALPEGACPGPAQWSADGKHFAFANTTAREVELWVGETKTGIAHRVGGVQLNPALYDAFQWLADQKTILVKTVPANLGMPPAEPMVPTGPSIEQTDGKGGKSSTYEARDTLKNTHDEDLFDYYIQSQLALVNIDNSAVTPIGKVANYEGVDAAPDGKHVLVTKIHKPYSYVTTYARFPKDVSVWDVSDAKNVVEQKIASLPLTDRVPIHGVPEGPREFSWRANESATLIWPEALDGGDWNKTAPFRDKVMELRAPFTAEPTEIAKTETRFGGYVWSEKGGRALLYEYDANRHWEKTLLVDVDDAKVQPRIIWDLSEDEHYKAPGSPVMKLLANGAWVMRAEGDAIYLRGDGSSPDGDRPFLDKFDLVTLKTERLFRSDKSSLERFLAFDGAGSGKILTWHQSVVDPPNLYARVLGKATDAAEGEARYVSTAAAITQLKDPTPEVREIKKRLVKYKRADGLDLSFTLYTPPGYKEGTRVPTILYAYPLDYADASAAGQVTGSQQTFTQLAQYRLLLLAGYAIIDDASFPVVGDPKKAYDTYLEQLVADAKAAVDEAVRIGVADPEKIGVTGHSHGALMTVNLVAHSDLFKAGVATSGSYNKTLTPFGFQNERRSVWEAPDVYEKVSPFFSADKLKTPILLIHGEEDANPGTTPIQSQKMFEAIRGNGGTARLVMLPHEPHWYTALESNEQEVYEMITWFDKYVKAGTAR